MTTLPEWTDLRFFLENWHAQAPCLAPLDACRWSTQRWHDALIASKNN